MRPAGFWRREVAWTLDAAPIALAALALASPFSAAALPGIDAAIDSLAARLAPALLDAAASGDGAVALARAWLATPALGLAVAELQHALWTVLLPPLLAFAALWLAWTLVFEASPWQATPGKRALGLRVTDANGRPLRARHVAWRYLCGALSWLTLNVGHAMAALPPGHRSLHDIASRTRVEHLGADKPLPRWAQAWVALQVAALLAVQAWALAALQSRLLDALELAARG